MPLGGLAAVPLVGFSVFLKRLGLPALPLSVLVKGDVSEVSDLGDRMRVAFETCVLQAVKDPERYPVLVLFFFPDLHDGAGAFTGAAVCAWRRCPARGATASDRQIWMALPV